MLTSSYFGAYDAQIITKAHEGGRGGGNELNVNDRNIQTINWAREFIFVFGSPFLNLLSGVP